MLLNSAIAGPWLVSECPFCETGTSGMTQSAPSKAVNQILADGPENRPPIQSPISLIAHPIAPPTSPPMSEPNSAPRKAPIAAPMGPPRIAPSTKPKYPPMIPPMTTPAPEPIAPPRLLNPKIEKAPAIRDAGQVMREHQVLPTSLPVLTRPAALIAAA